MLWSIMPSPAAPAAFGTRGRVPKKGSGSREGLGFRVPKKLGLGVPYFNTFFLKGTLMK